MGSVLSDVRDVKEYVKGLEVPRTGRCSLLESDCFREAMSLTSSAYSRWSIVRLSVKFFDVNHKEDRTEN